MNDCTNLNYYDPFKVCGAAHWKLPSRGHSGKDKEVRIAGLSASARDIWSTRPQSVDSLVGSHCSGSYARSKKKSNLKGRYPPTSAKITWYRMEKKLLRIFVLLNYTQVQATSRLDHGGDESFCCHAGPLIASPTKWLTVLAPTVAVLPHRIHHRKTFRFQFRHHPC